MKKIFLFAFATLGIQAAIAQTATPVPPQNPQGVNQKPSSSHTSTSSIKTPNQKGSAGTYTTGSDIPAVLPADTATTSRKNNGYKKPVNPTQPQK